eukprot:TRINITY_DN7315_c0_g1_i2.p1 TRINITY_DN7315_c0_g1~~TRINITY_DN7315_c0_g1_i2.p1  ORF type:complete len:477 (+),score=111.62 TRINITY_DN7315_c0_g1_i2:617-2047(+)
MIENNIKAILCKVASMGLNEKHLGKDISEMYPILTDLNDKFGVHVCGEGGEYESLTLDSPLFKNRLVIDEQNIIMHDNNEFAPVCYLDVVKAHVESKDGTEAKPIIFDYNYDELDGNYTPTNEKLPTIENISVRTSYGSGGSFNCIFLYALELQSADDTATILLESLQDGLEKINRNMDDIFFCNIYMRNMNEFQDVNKVYKSYFGESPPARACFQVKQDTSVKLEFYITNIPRKTLHVQSISEWAPACIGPYSQANQINIFKEVDGYEEVVKLVVLAGQIAIDPPTMELDSSIPCQDQLDLAHLYQERVLNSLKINGEYILSNIYFGPEEHVDEIIIPPIVESNGQVNKFNVQNLPKNAKAEIQSFIVEGVDINKIVQEHNIENGTVVTTTTSSEIMSVIHSNVSLLDNNEENFFSMLDYHLNLNKDSLIHQLYLSEEYANLFHFEEEDFQYGTCMVITINQPNTIVFQTIQFHM